ncbi:hypothetical protein [Fibrella aquatilis]|uniref:Glycosyl transferase family 8 n=1 Tax=Fibrella aquatilis TaxID=2817059 RepID=A0A939G345_9BACT|nr:hypothetical protein [Fibrella aquatilis]MBO0931467.1 hypothetical protein [Fibrella aquatilis]
MQQCYVSVLCNDNFLPGVLAMNQSLKNVGATHKYLVLLTPDVSAHVRHYLEAGGIRTKLVESLANPYAGQVSAELARTYTKLQVFGLTDYQKVVSLDLDMLVCANFDDVFNKPGWSAVNAGGMLPEHADWLALNSGFLVVEPNADLFADMLQQKDILPSYDKGDQGFLHSYFPEWSTLPHLHLDHAHNLYVGHLNRYHHLFGYHLPTANTPANARTIRVLHFWGPHKPWDFGQVDHAPSLYNDAFRLWWENFEQALANYPAAGQDNPVHQLVQGVTRFRKRVLADFMNKQAS